MGKWHCLASGNLKRGYRKSRDYKQRGVASAVLEGVSKGALHDHAALQSGVSIQLDQGQKHSIEALPSFLPR